MELKKVQVDNSCLTQEVKNLMNQLQHVSHERATLQQSNTDLNYKIQQLSEEKANIEEEKLKAMVLVDTLALENATLIANSQRIVKEAEKNSSEKVEMERVNSNLELKVKTSLSIVQLLWSDLRGKKTTRPVLSVTLHGFAKIIRQHDTRFTLSHTLCLGISCEYL